MVACRYHRLKKCRQLVDRDGVRAGGILVIALPGPDVPRAQLEHSVNRRASDDPIVVVGVALGLHERLSAASGAPDEVGAIRIASIETADDRLGLQCEFVYGPIAVILDLLSIGP